jgi:endonuclease-8
VPEGDTVFRQAARLHRALSGRELTRCELRVPAFATVDFTGSVVDSVTSRGKHLLVAVAGQLIHSHLKMEGSWQVYPAGPGPGSRWKRPAHTARAVLGTGEVTAVGFSLGLLEVIPAAGLDAAVGHLGPDLLGPDWDAEVALARLAARPERPLGLALLDQRNLAGIGNVYANELCFLFRTHPLGPVGAVPDLPALVAMAKRLLEANKDRPVRSTTGGPARGEAAVWVYGRAGKPCKRCGAPVQHGTLPDPRRPADRPRDTYYCPRCQPPPPPPN